MPLEFAAAAFRFGHCMIRDSYDLNRNYGRDADEERGRSTGSSSTRDAAPRAWQEDQRLSAPRRSGPRRPCCRRDMVWEADRLCDPARCVRGPASRGGSTHASPRRSATCPTADWRPGLNRRRPPGAAAPAPQPQPAAGLLLSLPTGQAAADALGLRPLTADELDERPRASPPPWRPAASSTARRCGSTSCARPPSRPRATISGTSAAASSPRRSSACCSATRPRTSTTTRPGIPPRA